MTAVFSSNNCNYLELGANMEFLSLFEHIPTIASLFYSLMHLKNISTISKQRQGVISACSTNDLLAENFPNIDRKIFIPCILSELIFLTSSCCFILAKFYEVNTKIHGYEIIPFCLAALETAERRTMNNFYRPNINTLISAINNSI